MNKIQTQRIALVGAGCIGSTVAAFLARAGHDVTLVARGRRRAALAEHGLRVRGNGANGEECFRLPVAEAVEQASDAELLIVTVQMQQVDALLPALARHPARRICFLLNAHPIPRGWLDALEERLVLGFPAMLAGYRGDVVSYQTLASWMRVAMITTLGPARGGSMQPAREVASVLDDAGLVVTTHRDMESWLATHAALVTPLLAHAAGCIARGEATKMSAGTALRVARGLKEALVLAQGSGATLAPANIAALSLAPTRSVAGVLWSLSRLPAFEHAVFDYAEHGAAEVDAMYRGLREAGGGYPSPNLDRLCLPASPARGETDSLEGCNAP